jgi:hypothetical protein
MNDREDERPEEEKEEAVEEAEAATFSEIGPLLDATNLPEASKARLREREYETEDEAGAAIQAEIEYVKELTKSGRPTGMGSSQPTRVELTERQRAEQFNEIMASVGAPEVRTVVPE